MPICVQSSDRSRALRLRALPCLVLLLVTAACTEDEPTQPQADPVATIEVTSVTDTLVAIDDTLRLSAVARDADGAVVHATLAWGSASPSVAWVDPSTGTVTATGAGSALVSASSGGVSDTVEVLVVQEVRSVDIMPDAWDAEWVGARLSLSGAALDANGHEVDGVSLLWSSSDAEVVTVDSFGVASARGVGGAEITLESASLVDHAAVTVTQTGAETVPPGLAYTIWFARTDSVPAVLVNGEIVTPTGVYDEPNPRPVWDHPGIARFEWEGDRIGLITDEVGGAGNLRVRDRVGEWTTLVAFAAVDFQLEGDRIGVLTSGGAVLAKDGISGNWTELVASGAADLRLEGERIAVLMDDGELMVKDGLMGGWSTLVSAGGDVAEFGLQGVRIGVLHEDGTFRVKDGIGGAWTILADEGAVAFDMSANRIAVRFDDGRLLAKDGIMSAWTLLIAAGGDVASFELEGNRIAVLHGDGSFRVKDGLMGSWTVLAAAGTERIQLQNDLIGMISTGGILSVKRDIMGPWGTASAPIAGPITQWRLLVDNPLPPVRTTPGRYAAGQAACGGDPICTSPWEVGLVPIYGRFCGAGLPTDPTWDAAIAAGGIDAMDVLCMHHDHAVQWYAEAAAIGNVTGSCLVHWGLHYSRLTQDGTVIATGASGVLEWNGAWGSAMPALKSIVDAYFVYTSADCDFGTPAFAAFDDLTASQN